jgi:hypothetical protein
MSPTGDITYTLNLDALRAMPIAQLAILSDTFFLAGEAVGAVLNRPSCAEPDIETNGAARELDALVTFLDRCADLIIDIVRNAPLTDLDAMAERAALVLKYEARMIDDLGDFARLARRFALETGMARDETGSPA